MTIITLILYSVWSLYLFSDITDVYRFDNDVLMCDSDFWTRIDEQYTKLFELEKKLVEVTMEMMEFHNQININLRKKEEAQNEDETCIYHYYVQRNRVELAEKIKMYEELKGHRDTMEAQLKVEEQNPPPRLYMNHFERRLMDWHIANLEYANATSINDLSMKNWDQVRLISFLMFVYKSVYGNISYQLCHA